MKHVDVAQKLLKEFKHSGADDVVIILEEQDSTQIKFANSKISTTQTWDSMSMDIFAAVEKKLITTSLHDFTDKAVGDAVKRLMKFAASAQPNKEYEGIAEGPFSYKAIPETFDQSIADQNLDTVDIVERGISTAMNNGAKRTAGVFETDLISRYLVSSNNAEAEEKVTKAYFSLRAFVERDASGHCVANARQMRDCHVEGAAARAAGIAKQAVNPVAGKQGSYDVIFEPLAASNIIEQMGSATSAFAVESGLSCLSDKIGKQIGSAKVNLFDNPTDPGAVGSAKFDEEGVPTQKNTLIENGVLRTYLHNTSTAKRHNTVTTANAGLISPDPFNIILEKGNVNKVDMFDSVKKGLWVTNVWYTRFQNYESGDFSTIPRDGIFLIEDGKVAQSIKDVRISENLLNIFSNIDQIGSDAEQVMGWEVDTPVTTPSILVKDVRVTKSVE